MMKAERPQVKVRDVVFGGEQYLLCVPLVGKHTEQLVADARQALEYNPDLFEWRADYFEAYPEPEPMVEALKALREAVGDKPILFTARHAAEDGVCDISDDQKFELIERISKTSQVDLIDIERRYGRARLLEWSETLHQRGVKLVVSHHSFNTYLNRQKVLEALQDEQDGGADLVKIVAKARSFRDLADFSEALHEARGTFLKVPLIAGVVGKASPLMRVLGDYLGSDMTFVAAGAGHSHPSQLHIQEVAYFRNRIQQHEC